MSATSEVLRSNTIPCLDTKEIRFSFVIEVMPKQMSFAPPSYDLHEFRKSLRSLRHSDEEDFTDYDQ
jgi:hypothetical protein